MVGCFIRETFGGFLTTDIDKWKHVSKWKMNERDVRLFMFNTVRSDN